MNAKSTKIRTMLIVTGILLIGLITLNGCKKDESATSGKSSEQMQGHEGHDHAAMMEESAKAVAASLEQKICPVMGAPINKDIFIEYKGKKVYFCCPGCEEKFKAEPEKYIAKLPQFQQQTQ
jgi:YHS domain-containing protein